MVPVGEYRIGDGVFVGGVCLYFLMVIAFPVPDGDRAPISAELFQAVIIFWLLVLMMAAGFLVYRGLSPVRLFGLKPGDWRRCVGVALVGIAGVFPVVLAMQKALEGWFPDGEGDRTVAFLQSTATPGDWVTVVFMAAVVAPLAEETFFRGYLYGVIKQYGGRWAAVAVTALMFAAIHGNPVGFLPLAALGVAFALAYELTGSLWTNVLMHVAFNGVTLAMLWFYPGVEL